jgi:small subunit ribosomal protein S2
VISVPIPGNDDAIRSVALITEALASVIRETRAQTPQRGEATEGDDDSETYSTDGGTEGDPEADRKKRRARRKRRPKPEAIIAARVKHEEGGAEPAPAAEA